MIVAELIREAALEGVRDELPHSIAVLVEEMAPREGRDDLIDVHANLYVERTSQKAIISEGAIFISFAATLSSALTNRPVR